MERLIERLGNGPVALDTPLFIYFIEEHPKFFPILRNLFSAIDAQKLPACTSALTLLEILVLPLRYGRVDIADRYDRILSYGRGLSLCNIEASVLREAARLRAVYQVKTPDAIQIGSALVNRCRYFVTNDRRLPQIHDIDILQLEDFLESAA